jgi:hypothetical protein
MSYLKTRDALITKLLDATITHIENTDIAYDNREFDPSEKDNWLGVYFIPADSQPNGKLVGDTDTNTGFIQVSVFSKSGGYDVKQLEIIDSVLSEFKNSSVATYQDQNVCVLNSTVGQGFYSDGWWKRDITIKYLTKNKR